MNPKRDRLPHWLRRLVLAQVLGIYAAATLVPVAAHAAAVPPPASLAQVPQFLQSPPAPNVFITVDNSGSMGQEILPDMAGTPQRMFPMPLSQPYNSTGDGVPTTTLTGALSFTGFCHTINVARLRSPNFNQIYYNPRIRYRPWKVADANGVIGSFPEAGQVAYFNPVFPARGGLDLQDDKMDLGTYTVLENTSQDRTGRFDVNARCGDGSGGSDVRAPFALYYKFDTARANCDTSSAAASRDDLDCYERVEVRSSVGSYVIPAGNQRGLSDETGCTTSGGVTTCSYAAELRNFANWFQYYRSRTLLARGAMGNAVADLGPGFRIGLGLLNPTANSTGDADGYASTTVRLGVRDFTGANRQPWYTLLHNHDVRSSTPSGRALMEVGNYFDWKGANQTSPAQTGPWSDDPAAGTAQFAACRQSYHVYSTDGYWNESRATLFGTGGVAAPATGADDTNGPEICRAAGSTAQPQCYQYIAGAPGATSGAAFTAFGAPTPNSLGNPNNLRFYSSETQSLADIAMYFWYRDLQPGMANNVAPSTADPAFWQHVSTIAVAMGFTGTRTDQGDAWLNLLDTGANDPLTGNKAEWPTGLNPDGGDPKTADDLWHAAVNSHGRLFVASNPQELSAQLSAALNEIRARAAIGAAAASSSAFLSAGSGLFTAEISQGTWSGNLYRREIDPATLAPKDTDSAGQPLPRDANGQPYIWRASDRLAAPASRPIYTMRTGASPRDALVDFQPNSGSTGVDSAQMAELVSPNGDAATDVVNYLRGDRSKEQSAVPPGTMRDRPRQKPGVAGSLNNVLGTIANSAPLYVRDIDFGHDFLPDTVPGQSTYLQYLRANQGTGAGSGRTPVIWTGSNEGMFHAFNADTGDELFAYVPRAVIPNLSQQVTTGYQHRYIVDGVPSAGDAYIGPPGGGTADWRTVVISSLGAGGRAVFAIDATSPGSLDANSVYWELGQQSLTTSQYELLGSTLGPALIANVKDAGATGGGRWVAIFANGPESDVKRAALWVVDLQTGQPLRILDTGNGDVSNPNGLSTPAPLYDVRRQLDALYAGDLRGNMWKFDLSGCLPSDPVSFTGGRTCANPSPSNWHVALSGSPLFTTGSPSNVGPAATRGVPQPIFAKPLLRRHPDGGVLVVFGTGKLISPGDRESEDVQSVYGIWDKRNETGGLAADFRTTGTLVQQAITALDVSVSPTVYRMTNFLVNYGTKRGWFFDLGVRYGVSGSSVNTNTATPITPRERMVTTPIMFVTSMLALSFVPSVDSCDAAGASFLYRLDPLTGAFKDTGSWGSAQSGAVALPGSFSINALIDPNAQGSGTGSGVVASYGTDGKLTLLRINEPRPKTFRTWRQLLD